MEIGICPCSGNGGQKYPWYFKWLFSLTIYSEQFRGKMGGLADARTWFQCLPKSEPAREGPGGFPGKPKVFHGVLWLAVPVWLELSPFPAQGTSSTTARTSTPRSTTGSSSPWWATGSRTRSRSSPWTPPTSSRSRPATPRGWGPCPRPCSSAPPKVPWPCGASGLRSTGCVPGKGRAGAVEGRFPWAWACMEWIPVAGAPLLGSLAVAQCLGGLRAVQVVQTRGGCGERPGPVCHICSWEWDGAVGTHGMQQAPHSGTDGDGHVVKSKT